jgi:hypothetical protein
MGIFDKLLKIKLRQRMYNQMKNSSVLYVAL